MARKVMMQIIEHGSVRRGHIGIAIQDLSPELAQALDSKRADGAAVVDVERNSPAAQAGLERGDVVVAVDGAPVRSATELRNRIGLTQVGGTVSLTVERGGKRRNITMTIAPSAPKRRGSHPSQFDDEPQDEGSQSGEVE